MFILYPGHAASVVGKPLVIRWIGEAARVRARNGKRYRAYTAISDNVTVLNWAETYGRPVRAGIASSGTPGVVMPFHPGPALGRIPDRSDALAYR